MNIGREQPLIKVVTKGTYFILSLVLVEGVVVPWCNPLTLQPEQSGGMGSIPVGPHHLSVQGVMDSTRSALFWRSQHLALKNATSPSPVIQCAASDFPT